MVAVPANAAADVQEYILHVLEDGRKLVGDRFGGMEMARVEREDFLVRNGIAQVKLERADNVAFRADAKKLALDRIEVVRRIDGLGEQGIERFGEQIAWPTAVDGQIFHAIGNP